ncbi:MAG: BatA domain-containing protein, partial [Devosia nanyangense]|nr:BatA domain-containing protein [Devosia nanyangense]
MGFVAPIWLLLALSGLGVLYLHVRRRTIVELPSLDLWQRVASGRARKRPFRLPPWSLALLLQLAVVALLALALAEPMLDRQETAHRIFVLDARALSASIDEIKGLLATAPPDGANPVSLVTADGELLTATERRHADLFWA